MNSWSFKIKRLFLYICLAVFLVSMTGCNTSQSDQDKKTSQTMYMLGTVITLSVYGDDQAQPAITKSFDRIREIEDKMSARIEDSEISTLNRTGEAVLSDDTYYVLNKAIDMAKRSNGAFDPTLLPIIHLWGFDSDVEDRKVPNETDIEKELKYVGYEKVSLDKSTNNVKILDGMGIDLGGIAKGYAADESKRIFIENGVASALLDLGGNVVAIGNRPDGEEWRIGLKDPRSENESEYFGVVNVSDQTVVTSGDYERYFIQDGKRYHHIFDAKTGYPSNNSLISVTIISDSSIQADALSTAVFVMGKDSGLSLVETLDNTEAVVVTSDKKVYTTSGMDGKLEITSKEYTLQ